MAVNRSKEPQYQICIDTAERDGFERLGLRSSQSWSEDPKHLVFRLSRYKFVAKMLSGRKHVLEIGCGDAFGTRIVHQEVAKVTAIDFDKAFVDDVKQSMHPNWQFDVHQHDMLNGAVKGNFDAIYSLDVLEHIEKNQEELFLKNSIENLDDYGVAIIGLPSLESQIYASEQSKVGHVNCKSAPDLKKLMEKFFHNVFIFSMNDEIVHTGYHKMAHYIFAVCTGKRKIN